MGILSGDEFLEFAPVALKPTMVRKADCETPMLVRWDSQDRRRCASDQFTPAEGVLPEQDLVTDTRM